MNNANHSKSMAAIKQLDRATLEAAFFASVATLRMIAKGEAPLPSKSADRTTLTAGFINIGKTLTGNTVKNEAGEAYKKAAEQDEVGELNEAADLLKGIMGKKGGEQ